MSHSFWQANSKFRGIFSLISGAGVAAQFAPVSKESSVSRIFDPISGEVRRWVMKTKSGYFTDTVTLVDPVTQTDVASFTSSFSGSAQITFPSGLSLKWKYRSFNSMDRVWRNSAGEDLIEYLMDDKSVMAAYVPVAVNDAAIPSPDFLH